MKIKKLILIFVLFVVSLIFLSNATAEIDTGWPEKLAFTCAGNNCYFENTNNNDDEMTFVMKNIFHRNDLPLLDKTVDARLTVEGSSDLGYNVRIAIKNNDVPATPKTPAELIGVLLIATLAAAFIWYHHTNHIYKSAKKRRRK